MKRSVLMLENFHISKSTFKKASRFRLTVNSCFSKVCDAIILTHGQNWFFPQLVSAFKNIHNFGNAGCHQGKVTMHSFELWDDEDNLVAGEVGYAVGGCYTSLSGFYNVDSAGSVQMAATGCRLIERGYIMWDLGMDIKYKESLGAKRMSRASFREELEVLRFMGTLKNLRLSTPLRASEILRSYKESCKETTPLPFGHESHAGAS